MAQFICRSEKNSNPIYDEDRLLIWSIGERPEDTASHEPIALARAVQNRFDLIQRLGRKVNVDDRPGFDPFTEVDVKLAPLKGR